MREDREENLLLRNAVLVLDGFADGKAVGLDFGFMLAGSVGESIVADLSERHLGNATQTHTSQSQGDKTSFPQQTANDRFLQGSPPFELGKIRG